MIEFQNMKIVQAASPQTVANGSASINEVDCTGYSYVTYILNVGEDGTQDGAISVFKIQGSASAGGSASDITGAALTGSDLPGATDDGSAYAIHIDLRDKSKPMFHDVVLTEDNTGSGAYSVIAILQKEEGLNPVSAATRGFAAEAFA
jgi:hypothetical protein